tara:strand:+ start:1477 stop:1692 length:216 start_codon:yes stop_codon:yes gene_type:complete
MKVGDLVKVSNKGFGAIGCITKVCDTGYYIVHYFSQSKERSDNSWNTGGLWSAPYITLLKEVKDEKETGKT